MRDGPVTWRVTARHVLQGLMMRLLVFDLPPANPQKCQMLTSLSLSTIQLNVECSMCTWSAGPMRPVLTSPLAESRPRLARG